LVAWILTAIAVLYTIAVITASSFFILGNLVAHAEPNTGVPALLWSYTAAMGPWVFLARRDKEVWGASSPADVMTLFAQIAYLSIVVLLLTVSVSLMAALVLFVLIMIVGGVVNLVVLPDEVGH
jgi:hypothetical protein